MMDGETEKPDSTLYAVIAAYLIGNGFTYYVKDGVTYWGHRELGQGRTFGQVVAWQIGREQAVPDAH